MIKVMGAAWIFLGGGLVWFFQRRELRRRQAVLAALAGSLAALGEEIRLLRTPLPVLLERAERERDLGAFYRSVREGLSQGRQVKAAWAEAAEVLRLSERDAQAVREIGNALQGDEESVCKAIELASGRMRERARELEQRQESEEKRLTALCFCAAALCVIVLI